MPSLETNFILALSKRANDALCTTGVSRLARHDVDVIAAELGLSATESAELLSKLDERRLIGVEPDHFEAMPLAALYEVQLDREEFRRRNVLRRELLKLSARAEDRAEELRYSEGQEQFIDVPWLELVIALRYLHYDHLIWLDEDEGNSFSLRPTDEGYDLARNDVALRQRLPTSADEDDYLDLNA